MSKTFGFIFSSSDHIVSQTPSTIMVYIRVSGINETLGRGEGAVGHSSNPDLNVILNSTYYLINPFLFPLLLDKKI